MKKRKTLSQITEFDAVCMRNLYYREGLPFFRIASKLGFTVEAVKVYFSRRGWKTIDQEHRRRLCVTSDLAPHI